MLRPVLSDFLRGIIVKKAKTYSFFTKIILDWFFRVIFHNANKIYMAKKLVCPVSNNRFSKITIVFQLFKPKIIVQIIVLSYVWQNWLRLPIAQNFSESWRHVGCTMDLAPMPCRCFKHFSRPWKVTEGQPIMVSSQFYCTLGESSITKTWPIILISNSQTERSFIIHRLSGPKQLCMSGLLKTTTPTATAGNRTLSSRVRVQRLTDCAISAAPEED